MPKPKTETQLAEEAAALRQKIADQKRALAVNASLQRTLQRRARDKRRYQVGTLVDEAGLAGLADDVLRGLLAAMLKTFSREQNKEGQQRSGPSDLV
jgi:hypothetical protein